MNFIVAGLDIGNSKIVCVIAEYNIKMDKITVKAVNERKNSADYFYRGNVIDEDSFWDNVIDTISGAEKIYKHRINEIFVNISGIEIKTGVINYKLEQTKSYVELDVLNGIFGKMRKKYSATGYEIPHIFLLNSDSNTENLSNGKSKTEFKLTFYIFLILQNTTQYFKNIFKKNNIDATIISGAYASSLSITNKNSRKQGVLLVNIGAGTTEFCIINNNKLVLYDYIFRAGDDITKSIAELLNFDFDMAEMIKIRNSNLIADDLEEESPIDFDSSNREERNKLIRIKRKVIHDVMKDEISNIFKSILEKLNDKKAVNYFSEIIITGGSADILGIDFFVRNITNITTRREPDFKKDIAVDFGIGINQHMEERLKSYANSTVMGMVVSTVRLYKENQLIKKTQPDKTNILLKFYNSVIKMLYDLFIS